MQAVAAACLLVTAPGAAQAVLAGGWGIPALLEGEGGELMILRQGVHPFHLVATTAILPLHTPHGTFPTVYYEDTENSPLCIVRTRSIHRRVL